jgi:hypothetical protein
MGLDRESTDSDRSRTQADLVLPEGLEAALIGGISVVLVYLARDLAAGHWLHTPSVLGTLLFYGPEAARTVVSEPGIAGVYNIVHFAVWTVAGFAGSALMRLVERRAELRWLPFIALAGMIAFFFVLDGEVRQTGLGRAHLWIGGLASGAAVSAYLVWRHPGALRLWQRTGS